MQDVINYLVGDTTEFVAFLIMALFGALFSWLLQGYKNRRVVKAQGGFSLFEWLYDNRFRLPLTICAIIAGILFSEQLLGMKINLWVAFLSGFSTDRVIDSLVNVREAR
ncbi:MAG: hypothetical protein LC101_05000 [Flavobacteriales bacterium]|nr:hypothetical protein [Flavobacteriales bacterium]